MQWAKPRSSGNRPGRSNGQKLDIQVDLTGEHDNDIASISTAEPESRRDDMRRSSHIDRAQASTIEQASHATETGRTPGTANQWLPSSNSDQSSAWNYYSSSSEQNDIGTEQEGYEYDPYFGDMTSSQDAGQQNRSSWDAESAEKNVPVKAVWSQYILPFLVVGLVVFLAFLTLVL